MPSHSDDVLIRLAPEVPAAMVERAKRWTPDSVPSVAAPAASVILLRDGQAGLETYLLHRHARMAFAPSMVVFPGGRVDATDTSGEADPSYGARSVRLSKRQVSSCPRRTSIPGRTGSLRKSSPAAMTRRSSPRQCPGSGGGRHLRGD